MATRTLSIDFWGLCLLDMTTEDKAVTVRLPDARRRRKHWDERPGEVAAPHRGLLYVKTKRIDSDASKVSSQGAEYSVIEIDEDDSEIRFSAGATKPRGPTLIAADARDALKHVPNFRDFAAGVRADPGADLLAFVRLDVGALTEGKWTPDDAGPWLVPVQRNQTDQITYQKLAYVIRWTAQVQSDAAGRLIEIYEGDDEDPYAWLSIEKGSDPIELALGNVDTAVTIPFENANAPICDFGMCPDTDFKWLFRLFSKRDVFAQGGRKNLVVPRLATQLLRGASTPTCFPGGC